MTTMLVLMAGDGRPSGWRAVLFVTTLFVIGFVLVMVKRRLAPRTIAHWSGRGIHPDLTPAQAAVLLRAHPSIILGLALDGRLRDGDATIRSVRPFRIAWPDPEPDGPVQAALAAALGPEGEIDFTGACAALEAQYEETNAALESASGRLSALHYRQKVKDALDEVCRTGNLVEDDLPWILLANPNALYEAGQFGPGAEVIRDLSRFAGALRGHLLPVGELQAVAAAAKSGFFAYRRDLRAGRAHRDTGQRPRAYALPGPPDETLESLRDALDGSIVDGCPVRDARGVTFGLTVTGRFTDRPVAVVFGGRGVVNLEIAIATPGRARIEPAKSIHSPNPLAWPRVESGDPAFDEAFVVRAIQFETLAARLEEDATRDRIAALAPFRSITAHGARIVAAVEIARDETSVNGILTRLAAVVNLADTLGGDAG